MKYIVTKNCYGFQGRFWKEGETVDVGQDVKVPTHFKPIGPSQSAPTPATTGKPVESAGNPEEPKEEEPKADKKPPKGKKQKA